MSTSTITSGVLPKQDFSVTANQATIDRFTEIVIANVDPVTSFAGVRTAGWADGSESFEGFVLLAPTSDELYRLVDLLRPAMRICSTSTSTADDGRVCMYVSVEHVDAT